MEVFIKLIKIKRAHKYEQTNALIKLRTNSEAFTLLVFVVVLGITSAYVLDYSYKTKGMVTSGSSLEGYLMSTLYTGKDLYRPSEAVSGGINLVNVWEEDIILERVQYRLSVYSLNNDASPQVFTSTGTVEFDDIRVKPHDYYSFTLDETWGQKDVQGRQVPEGKYLIEVQIPSYNLTLSKIIYIKKLG